MKAVLCVLLFLQGGVAQAAPRAQAQAQIQPQIQPNAQPRAQSDARPQSAPPEETITRFDIADGLPNNTVHALHVDSSGMLWIGTSDGLARWDGYRFEVYRTGLPSTHIKVIAELDGHLYVMTAAGVARVNAATGRTRTWPLIDASTMIVVERELWITASGSIYRIRVDTGSMERVYGAGAMARNPVRAWDLLPVPAPAAGRVVAVPVRYVWASSPGGGLVRVERETLGVRMWPWPEGELRFPGLFRVDAHVYVSHTAGAYRARIVADTLAALELVDSEIFAHPVHDVVAAPWGLAFGTDAGVVIGPIESAVVEGERLLPESGPTRELSNTVLSVVAAGQRTLWMGTRNGLYRMQMEHRALAVETLLEGVPVLSVAKAASADGVAVVGEKDVADGAGEFGGERAYWVGTLGEGLFRVERPPTGRAPGSGGARSAGGAPGVLRHWDLGACSATVWSVVEASSGEVWAGTDAGLCVLRVGGEEFERVPLGAPRADGTRPEGAAANVVLEHPEGIIWAGTTEGLCRVGGACRAEFGPVTGLAADSLGRMWISTSDGRVFVDEREVVGPTEHEGGGAGLSRGEGGWHILPIGRRAYVSSSSGLFLVDADVGGADAGGAVPSTTFWRMVDGIVYGAAIGADGHVWISTSGGVFRGQDTLAPGTLVPGTLASGSIATEFTRVGAFQSEFNRRAILSDGRALLAGGMEGLTHFRPEDIEMDNVAPIQDLEVTALEVAGRDSSWRWSALPEGGVTLSHEHVSLGVELAAVRPDAAPGHLLPSYRYRLEGFDDAWTPAPARSARYTNLPPGRYTFRAQARSVGALAERAFSVYVRKAWYATWWFRLATVLLLGVAIGVGWRLRQAHIAALERVRARLASDLHDDVGSRLAGIALLSELVGAAPALGEKEVRRLSDIERSARELVTSVRDITWLVHPAEDELGDLVDRMRETAHQLLADREWTLSAPSASLRDTLSMTARRHIFLVFREALHNIGRHAGPDASVSIALSAVSGRLVLDIWDTGVGFEADAVPYGHGIRSMRDRGREAGGRLDLHSEPGRGTHIHLDIPLSA